MILHCVLPSQFCLTSAFLLQNRKRALFYLAGAGKKQKQKKQKNLLQMWSRIFSIPLVTDKSYCHFDHSLIGIL